jgi:hypothetical protein
MSTSLLLALLEAQEPDEADRTADYYTWIEAHWDGKSWTGGRPERKELMFRVLYDILHSSVNVAMPESGRLGTVLARALSEDKIASLQEDARGYRTELRAALRAQLIRHLDALLTP